MKPIKDKKALSHYAARFPFCQACGAAVEARALHLHHLVKMGRSDERCNLLRLCYVCHADVHTSTWFVLGIQLMIKKLRDPAFWEPERLKQLFLKNLPDLLPIPDSLLREWTLWRPVEPDEEVPF